MFHATGVGGRTMETLVDSGLLTAVMDITTTEICDFLVGGVLAAGPERLDCIARIDAMLDGLHPKARTVLLLSRLEGWSYPEIAHKMDVSLSTVEKHMAAGLRHCLALRSSLPWI